MSPELPADLSQPAIEAMVATALAAFAAAGTTAELKTARLAHTGEKAPLALANRAIGSIPGPDRKEAGQRLGAARAQVAAALASRDAEIGAAELERTLVAERVDVTLPTELGPEGARHPITALIDLMGDVFTAMGWEIAEGPEAEGEWLNFDALNIGPDHPARGTTDTLFVDPVDQHVVMRTHTSPVQIRSMLDRELPIYVVCPGKVYRADEFDATHVPVFHQIEGLCIDKGISLAHLKGTLDHLARSMFGDDYRHADASALLPVHRAVGRGRPAVLRLPRRLGGQPGRAVPHLQVTGLDRVGRLRCGEPPRPGRVRHRHRRVLRFRIRHGHRTHADVPQQRRRHARHGRGRRRFSRSLKGLAR